MITLQDILYTLVYYCNKLSELQIINQPIYSSILSYIRFTAGLIARFFVPEFYRKYAKK